MISILLSSCKNKDKIDLETLSLNENVTDLFKDTKTFGELREINTTLPVKYSNDINKFKFGNVNFNNTYEKEIVYSKVGLILENKNSTQISGIVLNIESTEESIALLNYLKTKIGNPTILSPEPLINRSGELLGYSAYTWNINNTKSMVLSQSYEYTDGKKTIASLLYLVNKNVKVSDANGELVLDRLIRTYKK